MAIKVRTETQVLSGDFRPGVLSLLPATLLLPTSPAYIRGVIDDATLRCELCEIFRPVPLPATCMTSVVLL